MAGTKLGGVKAAIQNKERHGSDFYHKIGARGGENGHTGGFAANRELARIAGKKGGSTSRKKRSSPGCVGWREWFRLNEHKTGGVMADDFKSMWKLGMTYVQLAEVIGMSKAIVWQLIASMKKDDV